MTVLTGQLTKEQTEVLAIGTASQRLGALSDSEMALLFGMPLSLVATTGNGGIALINGTQTFISWTAPNDGLLHRVELRVLKVVTSNETGGAITATGTGGLSVATSLIGAATVGGWWPGTFGGGSVVELLLQPAMGISIQQTAALTAGASKLYAEIWAS